MTKKAKSYNELRETLDSVNIHRNSLRYQLTKANAKLDKVNEEWRLRFAVVTSALTDIATSTAGDFGGDAVGVGPAVGGRSEVSVMRAQDLYYKDDKLNARWEELHNALNDVSSRVWQDSVHLDNLGSTIDRHIVKLRESKKEIELMDYNIEVLEGGIEEFKKVLKKSDQATHGRDVAIDMQKAEILQLRHDLRNTTWALNKAKKERASYRDEADDLAEEVKERRYIIKELFNHIKEGK